MKSVTIRLEAGKFEEYALVGDYVRIKTASVPVRIEALEGAIDATIEQGDAINVSRFERLRLSHADAADQYVTLLIGNGTSADSAKVGGSIAVSEMPPVARAMTQTAASVGIASAQLVAANASRRFLLIQNNDASAKVTLNVAGAAAVLGNGVVLAPGASVLFDVATPSAAITAIADVATAAGVVTVVEG